MQRNDYRQTKLKLNRNRWNNENIVMIIIKHLQINLISELNSSYEIREINLNQTKQLVVASSIPSPNKLS